MKWIVFALVVVSATTVFAKRCKSADDCEDGECCVNYVLVSVFGGHCQKMRNEGESCTPLLKDTEEKPDMYHFQCPCKEGLECVAKHEIKIGNHIIRHRPECVVPGEDETEETPFPDPDPE
ncbi:Toxin CSTX-20 like protein [Argiope bruennichi]|uniref:Toxin CSTX-20 like protein n=1 Tax=Argiope bruennichi TaxID=94029 RepID=A0A8T0G0C6_ARGBR|nr:Toxin CSTX-20 like protein [Argiope bruennichi]